MNDKDQNQRSIFGSRISASHFYIYIYIFTSFKIASPSLNEYINQFEYREDKTRRHNLLLFILF